MDFPTLDRGLTSPLSGVIFGLADIFGKICQKKVSICLSVTMAIMQIRSNFGQRGRHCWKLFLISPLFARPLTVLYWIIAFLVFRLNQTFVFNLQCSKLLFVFITSAVNCFLFPFDQWSVLIIEWVLNLRSLELSNIILHFCKFLTQYGWLTIIELSKIRLES